MSPSPPHRSRILLTGVNGQLGSALQSRLAGYEVVALDRSRLDLAQPDSIRKTVREIQPQWIVNPAAYTAVDKAESDSASAFAINAEAVAVLTDEAARAGSVLLHYSTDYVFEGIGTVPYSETDPTNPQNVYGASKLAGEQAVLASRASALIFRTSWVYNATGRNFLRTILRLARERQELRIVADQHGAPTSADDLAEMTLRVIQQIEGTASDMKVSLLEAAAPLTGIYHAAGSGETTWYGFAAEALRLLQQQDPHQNLATLLPITTAEYPTPAQRPLNSRLDCNKLANTFRYTLPEWKQSLATTIQQIVHELEPQSLK